MPTRGTKSQPKASRPHMPGYGLPKGQKGLLAWTWASERLRKSHNYWVATVRADGRPHLMPVWGLWMDGAFYFSTGRQSRKAKNLATNSTCVICTENSAEAVIVEERAGTPTRVDRFMSRYQQKYKFDMSGFTPAF